MMFTLDFEFLIDLPFYFSFGKGKFCIGLNVKKR